MTFATLQKIVAGRTQFFTVQLVGGGLHTLNPKFFAHPRPRPEWLPDTMMELRDSGGSGDMSFLDLAFVTRVLLPREDLDLVAAVETLRKPMAKPVPSEETNPS